jgi:hypothetical protein
MRNAQARRPWRRFSAALLGATLVLAIAPLASAAPHAAPSVPAVAAHCASLRILPLCDVKSAVLPTQSQLNGIYCTSSTNCWAVGVHELSDFAEVNQIQHWNGKKWSKVSTPNPDGTGSGATNNPEHDEILHWNSTKWSVIPSGAT